jgi:hypothetical protein
MRRRFSKPWFSTMPRVKAKAMTLHGRPVVFLVHPSMLPALVDLKTGDLGVIVDADQWHKVQRALHPISA